MKSTCLALLWLVFHSSSGVAASLGSNDAYLPTSIQPHISIVLPSLSTADLKELDHADSSGWKGPLQIGLGRVLDEPVVIGEKQNASIDWLKLYDGSSFFSIDLRSPGALGLRLHLEELNLPAPVELVFYDATNPSAPKASIPGAALTGRREFWTDTIFSQQVVMECRVPAGIDPNQVHFKLAEISHLYRLPVVARPKEGGCHNDVTCFPEWAEAAASVARITYVAGRNTYLCSGCLLASADGSSRADYFLAARHCITSQTLASTIEFYWLFQTANCNDIPPDISTVPRTTGGGLVLASGVPSDFCFLRLRQPAPGEATRANWTTQLPNPGEAVASIHHPDGSFKRICFGNLLGSDPYFWAVQWNSGATESGSSGAPLFNANHQLIGHLTGGYNGPGSSCDDPSAPDQFARFDVTYAKIRRWLGGSGGTGAGAVPQGTYNGLFYDQDNGAHLWNSGFISLKTETNGTFTGKLLAGAKRRSFSGLFDSDLHAQIVLPRGKQSPWIIQLQIAANDPTTLTGSVSDGNWSVALSGNLSSDVADTNSVAQPGRYNLIIPGDPASGVTPGGDSFGTVVLDQHGGVRLIASLADGTKITQATAVSANGDWPFYATLSTGHSLLLGWFRIADTDASDVSGDITWLKTQSGTNSYYMNGFEMNEAILGSRYTAPARHQPILNLDPGVVSFEGGGLEQSFSSTVSMNSKSQVSDLSGNHLAVSFSRSRGTFTGQVRDPNSSQTLSFHGVVLEKQKGASGFFVSTNQTGQVLIQSSQ